MKRWPLVLLVGLGLIPVLLSLGPGSTPAPPAPMVGEDADTLAPGTLRVRVEGLTSEEGRVAVALFDSAASFEGGTIQRSVRLDPTAPVWNIEGLPPGTYALKAYHDRDADAELDRNALGIPSEPYGFSNDARGTFGPPDYEAAAFSYDGTPSEIRLRVK